MSRLCTTFVLLASMAVVPAALAQSAKHTVQVSALNLIEETSSPTPGWVPILGSTDATSSDAVRIRTSQQKDLLFSVSIECGLYTRTLARSKGGTHSR